MNLKSKKRLQASFFAKVGTNAATFCAMFDTAPALCFYMNIGLDVLAALCGISVSTFRRTFLAAFHRSPGHYLTDLRLKAAMKQLTTSNRLISEIALSTGFFDQSHLTRVFVRERHMTPGEFRRRHRTYKTNVSAST